MAEFLAVLGAIGAVAAVSLFLGYQAAIAKNTKFHSSINKAYAELIATNKAQANQPTAVARSQGYSEGYEAGVADSYRAIEKFIRAEMPNAEPPQP